MIRSRLLPVLFLLIAAPSASAQDFHETFYVDGTPDTELIQRWSKLPGTRNFIFRLSAPSTAELNAIASLERASLLQLESTTYPEPGQLQSWRKLAAKGAQFIGLDLQLPNDEQVRTLNQIGFSRIIFLISYIPDLDEGTRVGAIQSPVSVTFATAAYPRYDDKALLLAIPKHVPLTFVGSYWPGYTHMDLLNMLPNPQRLRVSGEFPNELQLPYINNITRLQEMTIETAFAPPGPQIWGELGEKPIRWICKDWVPTDEELRGFADSAKPETGRLRFLTIDKDGELLPDERQRLEQLTIPVEWVHSSYIDF